MDYTTFTRITKGGIFMATARKLPSGSWRCLAYDYTDTAGKRHYRSFTADTKKAAELQAAQYVSDNSRGKRADLTVSEAVDRYITAKTAVLSPSTIRGYRKYQERYYKDIGDKPVRKLNTETMQLFVSSVAETVSPKTTHNVYGLLSSAVVMFRPDAVFRVTLPKKKKARPSAPSDADIRALFSAAQPELRLCIALAAFGSLRRGEICALKHGDVRGQFVSVHADMVANENGIYEYKDFPKTSDSVRTVLLPPEAAALIPDGPEDGFIVSVNPDALTSRFRRLRDSLGLKVRLHDLRHYYASIGAVLGVPDTYMSDFGGWRQGSGVMKEVYQNVIDSERGRYLEVMSSHFSRVMQHEMQHGNEKAP